MSASALHDVCTCCGSGRFETLMRQRDMPVSGVFRTSAVEPQPRADLEYVICLRCGLVRQASLEQRHSYAAVSRSTARQLPRYAADLVDAIRARGVSPSGLICEIGANDGAFLAALRSGGFGNLLGIEPSEALCAAAEARGLRMEKAYFTRALAQRIAAEFGPPAAIVCRHTLEHVPEPLEFLATARVCFASSGGGVLLIEVPDGTAIPELMNAYELWDEHLYCFAQENLRLLLRKAGFDPLSISALPHLDTRNIVAWCRPGAAPAEPDGALAQGVIDSWLRFKGRWPEYRHVLAAAIRGAPKPVHFIGASHVQSNLANCLDVGAEVAAMIDDDPSKLGKLPPVKDGAPAIISSPHFMATVSEGTLVLSGFGYPQWTSRLSEHARRKGMTLIDPKAYLPA